MLNAAQVAKLVKLGAAIESLYGAPQDTEWCVVNVGDDTWLGFRQRFAAHLAKFGHAIYDLDFAKAVPANGPASLLETLKFYLRGEALDPYARQEATVAAREQAVETMLTRLHSGQRVTVDGDAGTVTISGTGK